MTGRLTGNGAKTKYALDVHVYMDPEGLLPDQTWRGTSKKDKTPIFKHKGGYMQILGMCNNFNVTGA